MWLLILFDLLLFDTIILLYGLSVFDSYNESRRGEDRKIPRQARQPIQRNEIIENSARKVSEISDGLSGTFRKSVKKRFRF